MRVLVTGMIAGIDDEPLLKEAVRRGESEGLAVRYYNFIEGLEGTGGKQLHRLLGATNYLFQILREREYQRIGFDLLDSDVAAAIIRVPATIEWSRINIKLKDHEEIAKYIRPDVIVTLIDAEWLIRRRFSEATPGKPFLYHLMGHAYRAACVAALLEQSVKRRKALRLSTLPIVFTESGRVRAIDYHGSAHIGAIAQAQGLISLPEGTLEISQGSEVHVRPL